MNVFADHRMTNRLVLILIAVVLVTAAAAPARAQKSEFVGRAKLVNCHDHDTAKKSTNWAGMCMTCHVTDDARLIAAKHPAGDDFDLGAKFAVVSTGHWKSMYDKAAVTALGKAAAAKIIAARKGGTAAAPVTSAA